MKAHHPVCMEVEVEVEVGVAESPRHLPDAV